MEELRAENASLRDTNAMLTDENHRLVSRNLALSEQLDAWHDTRMRVQLLKELLVNDRRRMARADLKDDVELLALIEARVENGLKETPLLRPESGFCPFYRRCGKAGQQCLSGMTHGSQKLTEWWCSQPC